MASLTSADIAMRSNIANATSGGAAGANKLWLPLWMGEVAMAYDEYNVFETLVVSKTLTGTREWQFPVTGTVSLNPYWDAGEELIGGDAASTTIAVSLDKRPMAAHFEVDNVDLLITQWDYRTELARQCGQRLANTRDQQVAAYIVRAGAEDLSWDDTLSSSAGGVATWNTDSGGTGDPRGVIPGPVFAKCEFYDLGNTSGSLLSQRQTAALMVLQCIEDWTVYLQTINANQYTKFCAVNPQAFQDIRSLGLARDATQLATAMRPIFGQGDDYKMGTPLSNGLDKITDKLEYNGVWIIKSNHLPVTNSPNIGETKYSLSFANAGVCGIMFCSESVGALNLIGLTTKEVEDVRRNTHFVVTHMLKGTGVLRPELAAVMIKPTDSNTSNADESWASGTKANGTFFYSANGNAGSNSVGGLTVAATNVTALCATKYSLSGGNATTINGRMRRCLTGVLGMTREFVATS